ncbi:MAG: hypothetical protein KME11_10725 [Timaviella obliquedivisa GSE-PSE-MK23-08B]|nr:hypothetical protein [Timaviella obliquedivisa GSE-PSE-MK23-08B]
MNSVASVNRPFQAPSRLSHLRDIVKACVFHRVRDMRKGADDLQVAVTIASPLYDLKETYSDIYCLIDEAIADAIAFLPEIPSSDASERAVMEGAIAGVELTKRQAILKAQAEIQKIQSYIDEQEAEIEQLSTCILEHFQNSYFDTSPCQGSQLLSQ